MKILAKSLLLMLTIGILAAFSSAQGSMPAVAHYAFPSVYPPAARAVHAEGEVTVAVQVAEDGSVIDARALSGHPFLRRVSEEAANNWIFTPRKAKSLLTLRFVYKIQPGKGALLAQEVTGVYRVQSTDHLKIVTTQSYDSASR